MKKRVDFGQRINDIIRALEDFGPMTTVEIAEAIGVTRVSVSRQVARLTTETPRRRRRAHITQWVYDAEGARPYPRAVYALGDHPNARKPRPKTMAKAKAESVARRTKHLTTNFVFNLGAFS